MSYKIILDGKTLLWTTKFESEDNSETNETATHSGPLVTPPESGTYTLKVERATAYDYADEQEVYDALQKCKKEEVVLIAIKETTNSKLTWTYTGCLRSSYKQEVDENGEVSYTFELTAKTEDFESVKAE